MTPRRHATITTLALVLVWPSLADAQRSFTVRNLCPFTIWPAIFTDPGRNTEYPAVAAGWQADANTEVTFQVPARWTSGRIWGRRNCDFSKPGEGPLQCATGGCNGGLLCTAPGVPPATLAEWTLGDPASGNDFYDVSLVDGDYNLPMSITTNISCPVANCAVDLGPICPEVLRGPFDSTGFALGCKTSCFANLDGHPDDSPNCCSGSYNKPETCPVQGIQFYSFFKGHCPNAYAYAYDESSGTALWTCPWNPGASYTLTFCPPGTDPSATATGTKTSSSTTPTITGPPTSGTQAPQTGPTRIETPPPPWTSYPPFSNPTEPEDCGSNQRPSTVVVFVCLILALVRLGSWH